MVGRNGTDNFHIHALSFFYQIKTVNFITKFRRATGAGAFFAGFNLFLYRVFWNCFIKLNQYAAIALRYFGGYVLV